MFTVSQTSKTSRPIQALAAAAALTAAGAYLRHGTVPVVAAFRLGRDVEHLAADPARFATSFKLGYRFGHRDRVAPAQAAA